jgi:DNA polymerase-3 subunit alpha
MSSHPFVHLHCHSHYSLLDGASKIPDLIQSNVGINLNTELPLINLGSVTP